MKFVDVFQFLNYLLEEMSSYNCFSLQLLGGGDSKRILDREAGVCWEHSPNSDSVPALANDSEPT